MRCFFSEDKLSGRPYFSGRRGEYAARRCETFGRQSRVRQPLGHADHRVVAFADDVHEALAEVQIEAHFGPVPEELVHETRHQHGGETARQTDAKRTRRLEVTTVYRLISRKPGVLDTPPVREQRVSCLGQTDAPRRPIEQDDAQDLFQRGYAFTDGRPRDPESFACRPVAERDGNFGEYGAIGVIRRPEPRTSLIHVVMSILAYPPGTEPVVLLSL